MNAVELKNNFHNLIDNFNNESALLKFYSLMKKVKESGQGRLWNSLSPAEQEELLQADIESLNDEQLISGAELRKKHDKWL